MTTVAHIKIFLFYFYFRFVVVQVAQAHTHTHTQLNVQYFHFISLLARSQTSRLIACVRSLRVAVMRAHFVRRQFAHTRTHKALHTLNANVNVIARALCGNVCRFSSSTRGCKRKKEKKIFTQSATRQGSGDIRARIDFSLFVSLVVVVVVVSALCTN